jgi:hypothetical protein
MERRFQALNLHRGGGETEGRCRYGRGSGGGAAQDVEAASRQPTGQAVAARHRTGGGRRRRSGPSGLQRPGGPVLKMENENENGVGLDCEGRLGQIQIGPLRKIENYFFSNFCFKEMRFKSKVLNIFKPNLNWIKNRIKSNQLFGPFSNLEIWKLI